MKTRISIYALCAGLAVAGPAYAREEEQSAPASSGASGEVARDIIVTARRREESLQDIPVAVQVLGGDSLEKSGIRNGTDLVQRIPSLAVGQNSGRRDVIIFELRGISASDTLLPQDPGVATYVNEVVRTRPQGLQGALFDLESVQVLYGPQGTLFGRNSTAGAVLLSTRKPELGRLGGDFRLAFGDYGRKDVFAAFNIPIGDFAALRLAGNHKQVNGFTRELRTGKMLDDQNSDAFRASLLLEPAPGFQNLTVYEYYKSDTNGTGNAIIAARDAGTVDPATLELTGLTRTTGLLAQFLGGAVGTPGTLQGLVDGQKALGPRKVYSNADLYSYQRVQSVSNTTSIDLSDEITLKNIFGYVDILSSSRNDLDGSILPGLTTHLLIDTDQVSNEIQLQGSNASLDWIIGGFYFKEKGIDSAYVEAFGPSTVGRALTYNAATTVTEAYAVNLSKSLFGQATWRPAFAPGLSFTGGLRYTWDTRKIDVRGRTPGTAVPTCLVFEGTQRLPYNDCSRQLRQKFSDPSYTLSVDYKITPDVLVYLAHRRGYRSGGFNPRGTDDATLIPFKPEKITDFEAGLKSSFDIGTIRNRFNISAFTADYSNIQRSQATTVNGVLATSVVNAAAATIRGGEAQLTVEPVRGLEFIFDASLVDFKIDRQEIVVPASTGATPVTLENLRFPVSKWQLGFAAAYNGSIGSAGDVSLNFNYKWRSKSHTLISFPFIEPEAFIPSYAIANISGRLSNIGGSGFFVGAFVDNLFDKTALISSLSIQQTFGVTTGNYSPPRMFGVEVGAKF